MKDHLCECNLGMQTHTTAWDWYWGSDEILKRVLIHAACLHLTYLGNEHSLASPCLMDPRVSEGGPECKFLLLTHTKQLLIVTFCEMTAGYGASFQTHKRTHGHTEGQTDLEVEIVI